MIYFKIASFMSEDYRGLHQAPSSANGAPLHNLTLLYPDDVYSSKAVQFYGDRNVCDSESFRIVHAARNKPDFRVKIYRAIPKTIQANGKTVSLDDASINVGDWVTICERYAKQHCEYFEDCRILAKVVAAKDLYTDGNSIHEWGYYPS